VEIALVRFKKLKIKRIGKSGIHRAVGLGL
jgi:hypothetical protein